MEIKDSKFGYAKTFYSISTVLLWGFGIGAVIQVAIILYELFTGSGNFTVNEMIINLVDMLVVLWLLIIVRKILNTAKEGSPFVQQNIEQLRLLAAIYIGASVLLGTLPTIFHLLGLIEIKEIINLIRSDSFLLNTGGFITGFIFLFIAEVFEVGLKLKKENELTI